MYKAHMFFMLRVFMIKMLSAIFSGIIRKVSLAFMSAFNKDGSQLFAIMFQNRYTVHCILVNFLLSSLFSHKILSVVFLLTEEY